MTTQITNYQEPVGSAASLMADLAPILGVCMETRAGLGDPCYWICSMPTHDDDYHFFVSLAEARAYPLP